MQGTLYAPVLGEVKDITTCSDDMMAQKMLGDGILVIPKNGKIVSPCDGEIFSVTKTKHAVSIVSDEGLEILIHIGIDTVELNGKGFKQYVQDGEHVKKGQLLIEADFNMIKKSYDPSTMMIVLSKDCTLEKRNLNKRIFRQVEVIHYQS